MAAMAASEAAFEAVKTKLRANTSLSNDDLNRKLKLIDDFIEAVQQARRDAIRQCMEKIAAEQWGSDVAADVSYCMALMIFNNPVEQVPTADATHYPETPRQGTKRSYYDDDNANANDDCAREQFLTQYLNPSEGGMSAVDLLDQKIEQLIDYSENDKNMAPFIFLLQSAGYGKTRTMLELARKKRRAVFLPCKVVPFVADDSKSWKVPKSLEQMLRILENQSDDNLCVVKWIKFLEAVQESAESYRTPEELYNAQVMQGGKLGPFYKTLEDQYWPTPLKKDGQPVPPSACRPAINKSSPGSPSSKGETKKVSISATSTTYDLDYKNAKPVTRESLIVCLDEASALTKTSLKAFQRGAKVLGIVTIFSDTTASISKVMEENNASCSSRRGKLGQFMRPIYELPTFDLHYETKAKHDNLENLLTAGRPRWFSLFQSFQKMNQEKSKQATETNLVKLIEKVKEFLLHASQDQDCFAVIDEHTSKSVGNINSIDPPMVAMFSCRFGLGSGSKIAPLLAKYSLATIDHVTSNRDSVSTHYPSEPVLAEASAQYTSSDQENLFKVLKHVHAAVLQGMLDAPRGDIGEMCAAALLGLTMDKIRKERGHRMFCSHSVELQCLLKYFGCCEDAREVNAALDGWEVNFTHFDRPGNLDDRDLKVMWNRRMAYYAMERMNGLDLLIAIWHKEKGYATLRVQVKNFAQKFQNSKRNEALRKLEPRRCPPYAPNEKFSVGLLLCVNSVDKHCHLLDYNNPNKVIWPRAARSSPRAKKQPKGTNCRQEKLLLQIVSSFPEEQRNDSDQASGEVYAISKRLKKICCKSYTDDEGCWSVNWPLLQGYKRKWEEHSPPIAEVTDGSLTEIPTKTDSMAESVDDMDIDLAVKR
eukprot:scaffold2533_cov137-Cylindrotheca_fusiformis.AAC.3